MEEAKDILELARDSSNLTTVREKGTFVVKCLFGKKAGEATLAIREVSVVATNCSLFTDGPNLIF